jgi:hypothetical protein
VIDKHSVLLVLIFFISSLTIESCMTHNEHTIKEGELTSGLSNLNLIVSK